MTSAQPTVRPEAAPVLTPPPNPRDPESLRRVAWAMGEGKPAERYVPPHNHVFLGMVDPKNGFAHWRILQSWVDETAAKRGHLWTNCRLILRLYDVTLITFNGFNANRIQDHVLPAIQGHYFFGLPRPGTYQLAEVGFELRNREFIPAARSSVIQFPPDGVSGRHSNEALFVDDRLRPEPVSNLWEQDRVLVERKKPKLRPNLRIAAFTFSASALGHAGTQAMFPTGLANSQAAMGHEVHVFAPASPEFKEVREVGGVRYQPLNVDLTGTPIEMAVSFAKAAEKRVGELPPFDLFHLHEWMTCLAPWLGTKPTVASLSSIEATRLNGAPATPLSNSIAKVERDIVHAVDCILTPDWLRPRLINQLGVDSDCVHPFPMEGRAPTPWESPLDIGHVKMSINFGPVDRLLLYAGPIEHAAGVDILIEALPTQLGRTPNLRVAIVGEGHQRGHLEHKARQLGVAHAVRFLGHIDGGFMTRLLRACDVVALPSRQRTRNDEGVIHLARQAGKPVIVTHAGPNHMVRHEETGILTYDNPGSIVWALDRVLGDPTHAERMGRNGKQTAGGDGGVLNWNEAAKHYFDLCLSIFHELRDHRKSDTAEMNVGANP